MPAGVAECGSPTARLEGMDWMGRMTCGMDEAKGSGKWREGEVWLRSNI